MTSRDIIMGQETFRFPLCTFVQPVLCLQINCKINNTDWNKSWGRVLSQVVSKKYKGFCLDVHGCWHMYKHAVTLVSASDRC